MKIRFTVLAIFPLMVLLAGLLVITMQYAVSYQFDSAAVHGKSASHFQVISAQLKASASGGPNETQFESLSGEMRWLKSTMRDLQIAVVLDDTETIIDSSDPQAIGRSLNEFPGLNDFATQFSRESLLGGQLYNIGDGGLAYGVLAFELPGNAAGSNPEIGLIGLILDQRQLVSILKKKRLSIAGYSTLILFIVTVTFWILLGRFFIDPLLRLRSTIRSFSKGDYSVSANLVQGNEMGEISLLLDSLASIHREKDKAEASRNRLAQIVEDSVSEIYVADAKSYKILNANRAARENMGYSLEECVDLMPWDFVGDLTEQNVGEVVALLSRGDLDFYNFETTHKRKDGSIYPVQASLQIMTNQSPPVVAAMVQDMTERNRQQEDVRLRDRAIEELDVGVGIVDVRKAGRPIVYVNRHLCEMTGYTAEQLIGSGPEIFRDEDHNDDGVCKIDAALAKGDPVQVLMTYKRKTGTKYIVDLYLSPVHDTEGHLTHYVGIIRDVTKKLETEAQLNRSQKIEAIGQLAGGVAHDFNNLLSVIIGNIEFLKCEADDEHQKELLNQADAAAQMGARLTRKLLSFAKQDQLEQLVLDVNEQIQEAMSLLRTTIGDNYSLDSSLDPDLWHICADPTGIENAVVNLTLNARDAMPEGGLIMIETHNVSIGADEAGDYLGVAAGDYVRLSVSDSGCGMSADVVERIFEPFYTTKDVGENSGLGLASTYGFARQSGGNVIVDSNAGSGAMISVLLPRSEKEMILTEPMQEAEVEHAAESCRVLVVEDDEMVMEVTVERLHAFGYLTTQVTSGLEAIALLEKDASFDLVLTDLVMGGGVSGYDVADWVHQHLPSCKVLLTSGYSDQRVEGQHSDKRPRLLQKPYRMADLKEAINAVLEEV
ncbi:hybrid sensor histidine kinase/response regulator [Granulosicoccus antarcticus]|uniref:histidine kinase n=1 Tax=Granulosicoccus antarcticus IMCC3135 TaxID=1192854 RepID=A0A2Z2P2U4_9GAMM|nr:PAS domain S-box protein [Granulosicoccus antarcticus]ASJ74044.1 Blue-light-activated protein [Granulosicoccus antarcticus IMCC3135]